MSEKLKILLRWVFILPGAILAALLATFPLHWILILLFFPSEEADVGSVKFFVQFLPSKINAETIEYLLYPCIMAFTFIFIGSKIAPRYKYKTAIVLFGVYILTWLITAYMALFVGKFNDVGIYFTGRTVLALSGAIIGLFFVKKANKKS